MTRSLRPSLLCLNLRREIAPSQETWMSVAAELLAFARAQRWHIGHLQRAPSFVERSKPRGGGAIAGLEPLCLEPVFIANSAAAPAAATEWAAGTPAPIYLIGVIDAEFAFSEAATVVADATAHFGRRNGNAHIRVVHSSQIMRAPAHNVLDLQRYRAALRQSRTGGN